MWKESPVYLEDLSGIVADSNIPWEKLSGKTVLVTGATGLIGATVVNALLYYGKVRVLALVRNLDKARSKFAAQLAECGDRLAFVVGDVCSPLAIDETVDYIVHGASQTASKAFVEQPVETIDTAVNGTRNVLELARKKQVQAFVYLSSMELYGYPEKGHVVTENEVAGFDTTVVRNSYPIGKQICEALCSAYDQEYGVPVMILRLTQTFGPGVEYTDQRIFGEFIRCAREKRDIVLKTKGETERCYLYTADAVRAILTVMLKGERRQAYTAANAATYCSIAQMAEMICRELAQGEISVRYELADVQKLGYANTLYMNLDTTKLQALGWKAQVDLLQTYKRTLESMIY
ncbi:MAG: NAD(P)-dependent oxidoreductase [Clostridiales bacterium]|nr:NAD(P)-dependent oxidoreductase [Clostridiales bacterium]